MNPFEAYMMYLAMKRHFSSGYDYVKYNGKVNVLPSSLEKRRDKYQFHKLSKQTDPIGLVIANLFEKDSAWVGDLFDDDAQRCYAAMKKRRETLAYTFKQELLAIDDIKESFKVNSGNHPELLKLYLRGKVSPETLLILDGIGDFFTYWDKEIVDAYRWPEVKFKLNKLRPFFQYDKDKYLQSFKSILAEQLEPA